MPVQMPVPFEAGQYCQRDAESGQAQTAVQVRVENLF